MAHTPGPWTVVFDRNDDGDPTGYARVLTPDYRIPEKGWCSDYVPVEDAHLIAAAPDLLAAVKGLLNLYQQMEEQSLDKATAAFDNARAAIAKAEGR